ncbi:MAG: acetyl-CoA carboxylase biotin carboxyl carrier protein [Chloroflexota bacterium]|jgi:acetyl-CoA carboxylase biotin carboxyl carrier protein
MELDELKQLMAMLKDTDITDLQIEKEGTKVKIRREKFFGHLEIQHPVPSERRESRDKVIEIEAGKGLVTITSPIVGTFYRAPSPEASPFVEVGAKVKKGQVLCIIEAMKLMNEIESEVEGEVVRILVDNGHPVEYGEPLFLIEPLQEPLP